jgi:hypothetical protein
MEKVLWSMNVLLSPCRIWVAVVVIRHVGTNVRFWSFPTPMSLSENWSTEPRHTMGTKRGYCVIVFRLALVTSRLCNLAIIGAKLVLRARGWLAPKHVRVWSTYLVLPTSSTTTLGFCVSEFWSLITFVKVINQNNIRIISYVNMNLTRVYFFCTWQNAPFVCENDAWPKLNLKICVFVEGISSRVDRGGALSNRNYIYASAGNPTLRIQLESYKTTQSEGG